VISVVAPVYLNEATLEELHERLEAALRNREHELLFVVDGSPDRSGAVLGELAARNPRVSVLALPRNAGQQRAILAGLAAARGSAVVVMDADLQDPPEAIPAMLARLDGAAAVFAGRRGSYESRGRLAMSRLFKRVNAVLCGVPPDAGAFVALRREAVDAVLGLQGPPPVLTSMIGVSGVSAVSIPVERSARTVGRSAYGAVARARAGLRGLGWGILWRFGLLRRLAARHSA
jgi:glycosyltransferase involved in cell wall biosynthesis